jgi:chaperonin GroEL
MKARVEDANDDQTVDISILRRSIEEPLRQIVENGGDDPALILNQVKAGKGNAYGHNAANGECGDMLEAGILLTTEVMIAEAPKDEEHSRRIAPRQAWPV